MTAADRLLAQAAGQVNAGDLAAAWNSYLTAAQAVPGHPQAWLGLGMVALLRRDWALAALLADKRQTLAGDGFAYFHDLLTAMMGHGLSPLVEALGAHLPAESPYGLSQMYYQSCARLLAGDEDGAFALLGRLKPRLAALAATLPIGPEDRFNVAYRQATLIEDGDYPDALDPQRIAAAAARLPALTALRPWPAAQAAPFVLLAAADGPYLRRFAADFLESADASVEGAVVHLHAIAADDETLAGLAAAAAACRNPVMLTAEDAAAHGGGAYCASARFLVAGALMARYGRPLMITDLDIRFIRPLGDLAEAARPFAFASFVHDGWGPCSRLPAVLTWFAADADGAAMLEAARHTILSKLDVPWPHNWMLDQAALMTARRWLRRRRPRAGIGEFNTLLGRSFEHFLVCSGDEEDKAALIRAAARAGAAPLPPVP